MHRVLRSPLLARVVARRMSTAPPSTKAPIEQISIATAKMMPKTYSTMPNEVILNMAVLGDQEAREERLIREIMAVESVSWRDAQKTFKKMVASNRRGLFVSTLPYKFGIFTAVSAGLLSFPFIFEINSVMWFNEQFVTTDVPESKDLETPLEVGGWAWNWMEPPLGQISFFLLCMQFARSQLENLGAKPYTGWFKDRRASRLISEFPAYNEHVLRSFSEGDSLSGEDVSASE